MTYVQKYINNKSSIGQVLFLIVCIAVMATGCKKNWLDEKPQLSLVVPTTIADYQALLDNTATSTGSSTVGGNVGFNVEQLVYNEISAGDFYLADNIYTSNDILIQNLYTWAPNIYTNTKSSADWNTAYKKIFYTNIVTDGILKITPLSNGEKIAWNQVYGSALFFRAYNHYEVAQEFCKAYDKNSASTDLGIPLRLESDVNISSVRSSVQKTYDQIIQDLKQARDILPVEKPSSMLYKLRPTKAAANAMLARVYLSMGDYDNAYDFANQTLQMYDILMDYNKDLRPAASFYRVPRFNSETIFHTKFLASSTLGVAQAIVDSNLLKLYDNDDLRKTAFFKLYRSFMRFVGSYDEGDPFSGIATDEIYLIRAESNARKGNVADAVSDLNALLVKRWTTGLYTPFTTTDATVALKKILTERRKELCFRGLRWTDLRRLNKEPLLAITLTRKANSVTYNLPPNDPKYVLPIPPDVIQFGNVQQNDR